MKTLTSMSRGALRKFAAWPLTLLGQTLRAQALEGLTEKIITSATFPGGRVQFYAPSPLLLSRAASLFSKEPEMIQWINTFEEGAVFWDVGANVGVYSLYAAARRKVSVLAFEPSAANFYVLCRNIKLNELSNQISAYCVALSGQTGLGVLNLESSSMGSAVNQFGQSGEVSPYSSTMKPAAVHGTIGFTIDDFLSQFKAPCPNYLKMDVDGIELDILRGARQTLENPRLVSVLVELSLTDEEQLRDATALFQDAGFRFVSKGVVQGTERDTAANHLFERITRRC